MRAFALALALSALQDPADERIRDLVSRLGADEIDAREEAQRQLIERGEPAAPLLRKHLETARDPEVVSRLKATLLEIEKQAQRAKVYRPARLVTIKARDARLEEVLKDAGRQAGVEIELPAELADRRVTLDAEGAPLLAALDRLCAAEKDLSCQPADGKLRLSAAKHAAMPSAYADGFRARLRRHSLYHETDRAAGAAATAVVLYFEFDSEPGISPRSAVQAGPARGTGGGAEVTFKPASEGRATLRSGGAARRLTVVDDVPIFLDAESPLEHVWFLKEAPAALRRLETLRVKAKYRFVAGSRTVSCKMPGANTPVRFEGIPVKVSILADRYLDLALTPEALAGTKLEDYVDVQSLVIVTGGKELRCSARSISPGVRYLFEHPGGAAADAEVRLSSFGDVFEKEVEFEFRDLPLRD